MARRLRSLPQLALDEALVDDAKLENALELRENERNATAAARKRYRDAHETVVGLLAQLELTEGAVRVGRFRIERKMTAPRSVSFETAGSSRIAIQLVEP